MTSVNTRDEPRAVVIVTYPGVLALDLAGPLDVFGMAAYLHATATSVSAYQLSVQAPGGRSVQAAFGLRVRAAPLQRTDAPVDTLIVVGGPGAEAAARNSALIHWLQTMARTARRVCSVCSGAYLLAASGCLKNHRATTHWNDAKRLAQLYPDVKVEPDRIFIQEDRIWTSAGVTAGIDLSLALVEEDLGRTLALKVARMLVAPLKRQGGQSQFSELLELQSKDDRFGALHDWIAANLTGDLTVSSLAAHAGMAPRTFVRTYVRYVGQTPARAVEAIRVQRARLALQDTRLSVKDIARLAGFGDDERMRRAFLRTISVSPADYRSRFATSVAHQ